MGQTAAATLLLTLTAWAYARGYLDWLLLRALVALAVWLCVGSAAFAADTTVSVLPWYQVAEPFVLTAFGVVFSALLGLGLSYLQKRTGIVVDQHWRDVIQQAAMNGAGRVLAHTEGNVSTMRFDVHNQLVKEQADAIIRKVPQALDKLGVTPEAVADLVVGKIGQLQAAASVSPVVVPTDAAKKVSL